MSLAIILAFCALAASTGFVVGSCIRDNIQTEATRQALRDAPLWWHAPRPNVVILTPNSAAEARSLHLEMSAD